MMESPIALEKFGANRQAGPGMIITPAIDEDGRIRLPGSTGSGLSVEAYLPLVHLYANIVEASRILDRHRSQLRRLEVADFQAESADIKVPEPLSYESQLPITTQTPLTELTASRLQPHLYYKREDQTITKAYKVRGALVSMAKMMESRNLRKFLTVSTGNHALGVLKAAELLGPETVRVVVPHNTALGKLDKLNAVLQLLKARKNIKADLIQVGQTFDEAREWAMSQGNEDEGYLDPYGDPWVVAGQGTLGLELSQQIRALLQQPNQYKEVVLISPVGGGGLLTGTAAALRMSAAWEPAFRNLDLRFLGLRLEDLTASLGDAIRVGELAPFNRRALDALRVPMMTMSDADMAEGQSFVKQDIGRTVEGASGGAIFPALTHPDYKPNENRLVVSILSGANAPKQAI